MTTEQSVNDTTRDKIMMSEPYLFIWIIVCCSNLIFSFQFVSFFSLFSAPNESLLRIKKQQVDQIDDGNKLKKLRN